MRPKVFEIMKIPARSEHFLTFYSNMQIVLQLQYICINIEKHTSIYAFLKAFFLFIHQFRLWFCFLVHKLCPFFWILQYFINVVKCIILYHIVFQFLALACCLLEFLSFLFLYILRFFLFFGTFEWFWYFRVSKINFCIGEWSWFRSENLCTHSITYCTMRTWESLIGIGEYFNFANWSWP